MKVKLLGDNAGKRTFAVVLQHGDEAMGCLHEFADGEHLSAAQVTAIGAFRSAQLGYFDWETKKYVPIDVNEQVEVASLVGNRPKPKVQLRATPIANVTDRNKTARSSLYQ